MLLKMFLVFVRPISLSCVKSREMKKGNWSGEYRFRVRNETKMVKWEAHKMCTALSEQWKPVGLKMFFLQYRGHQTGLVKEKCRHENCIPLYKIMVNQFPELSDDRYGSGTEKENRNERGDRNNGLENLIEAQTTEFCTPVIQFALRVQDTADRNSQSIDTETK